MKKTFLMIMAVVALLGVATACTDENIGSSITDTRSSILVDSAFEFTGVSVPNTKVPARTSTQLLGQVSCEGYGRLTSDVVTQLMPANRIDTAKVVSLDSAFLTLSLPLEGFTGDSLVPMRITAYELTKQLPDALYSDFSPVGYYNPNSPLGSVSYSAKSATINSSTNSSTYTTNYWREVHVPLPVSFVQRMRDLFVTNSAALNDPEAFAQYFPGLYITNSYGSGRVMNYNATEVEAYYTYADTTSAGKDTTYTAVQSYAASTPEVRSNNNITMEVDEQIKTRVANGEAIVMGPTAYEVETVFPIQEIIDRYKASTADGLAVLNSLSLTIPVEELDNQYDIAPPEYLLMVKRGMKDDFFEGDSLTNSKDSFYATYDSSSKQYVFSGLRDYVLNILENQNGIATDDDIHMIITPIDVSTYTYNSSYSYYYSTSTSTVVTKIAPSISLPTLAKLNLDKAKIKFTYSKQTLY